MKPLILALAILLPTAAASAQEITPPVEYTWITTSCETWDCAASAFVLSAGDRNVIVLPTRSEKRPWLVLRRVQAGSVFIPEDEPFSCEVFGQMNEAVIRYNGLDGCMSPLLLNTPDGRAVVMSMAKCETAGRRRSAGH
jgi:hypothetical protein